MMKNRSIKRYISCMAVFSLLMSGCGSSSAAAEKPAEPQVTEDTGVIPESDDFFDSSVAEEEVSTVPVQEPEKTAEPEPQETAQPAEPAVSEEPETQEEEFVVESYGHEPGPEDFDFYEEIEANGVPEEANYPALKYAEGEWKYQLTVQFITEYSSIFEEYGYADLGLNRDKETVIITLHPRMAGDGYELWPESEEEVGYEPFEGGFDDDGGIKLIGNEAVIYLRQYYAYEGREYMLGEIWISEEDSGTFLMTRGQE